MKRIVLLGILLSIGACRTAAPTPGAQPAGTAALGTVAPGPFEAVEASLGSDGEIERMHRDAEGYIALVATGADSYELIQVRQVDGVWKVTGRTPATQDYLWPQQ